ncbi:MAG TPA: hypothetical protein VF630_08445 [Hymenobacter sp.]
MASLRGSWKRFVPLTTRNATAWPGIRHVWFCPHRHELPADPSGPADPR